jgi:hypothetical protein
VRSSTFTTTQWILLIIGSFIVMNIAAAFFWSTRTFLKDDSSFLMDATASYGMGFIIAFSAFGLAYMVCARKKRSMNAEPTAKE